MSKRIFISGASSGIGEYLAYVYAKQGATLGLSARRKEKLETVAATCREYGGKTYIYQVDAKDRLAAKEAADNFIQQSGGIDIVIANAGIGGHDDLTSGDATAINNIIETNVMGVNNTLMPFIPKMKEQKSGILVNVSSIASFMRIPYHGGYAGAKVNIRFIADSWRLTLKKYNIQVTTICPGFIKTPMTAELKGMPFLMPVETAVEKIANAIDRGKKTFIFPWQMKIMIILLKILPDGVIKMFGSK
jgi:short-subunit dehydrogenase